MAVNRLGSLIEMELKAAAPTVRWLFELDLAHAEFVEVIAAAHRTDFIAAARRGYDCAAGGVGRRNLPVLACREQGWPM